MKKETVRKIEILHGAGDITLNECMTLIAAVDFLKIVLTDKPELADIFKMEYGQRALDIILS
jgi:hypothetical protein